MALITTPLGFLPSSIRKILTPSWSMEAEFPSMNQQMMFPIYKMGSTVSGRRSRFED